MNEQWMRWEPITHLGNKYSLDHVHDGMRGLDILLGDPDSKDKKVRVVFPYIMISYTVNPGNASLAMNKDQQPDTASACRDWSFFEVINSQYIAHLMVQSATIVETYDPRHFIILTTNARVDVVASYEPDVGYITMDLATKTLLYKEMTIPYIIRKAPTARIILHEPEKGSNEQMLHLAIDCEMPLDATLLKEIQEELKDSDVPLQCSLIDIQTLSEDERSAFIKHGVVWRNK